MRFIVFSVFFTGWIAMWWWTYVYHIKDCGAHMESDHITAVLAPGDGYPLSFRWAESAPVITSEFESWRDSVTSALVPGQILQITGIAYRDEEPGEDAMMLAGERAAVISDLFSEHVPGEMRVRRSEIGTLTADLKNRLFPGHRIDALMQGTYVYEIPDCACLFFPADSVPAQALEEAGGYLRLLAERVTDTTSTILIYPWERQRDEQEWQETRSSQLESFRLLMTHAGFSEDRIVMGRREDIPVPDCQVDTSIVNRPGWIVLHLIN